jgi:serine/threonine protein kinase
MLGRYQILKPLAKGGMAEVFLARTIGLKGFERHIVLKFIRVEHNANPQTIEMLLDEARLVASLHHRNIVQVHDVGMDGGQYFFAMEYVHGEDGRALLRKVKDKKEQIPFQHILTAITAAAAGLHYAHEMRGPDRKPLGIVHRDISPGNILFGFDDFGIAKTDKQEESTRAGELKGKVGYMSPEQCKALPLDRRTDVYMLGIVLYELCTVRRLFKGDNRFETMQQIVEGNIAPPSRYRKDLPYELEQIIMKALATDQNDRYQTADDLRLVLEAFATRSNLQISPSKLSDYLKDLFGERPEPWLVGEPPPDPPPPLESVESPPEALSEQSGQGPRASTPAISASVIPNDVGTEPPSRPNDGVEPGTGDTPLSWQVDGVGTRRKRRMLMVGIGAAVLAVGALAFGLKGGGDGTSHTAANTGTPGTPGTGVVTGTADAGAVVVEMPVDASTAVTVVESADAGVNDDDIEMTTDTPVDAGVKVARPVTGRPGGVRPTGGRPGGRPGGAGGGSAKPTITTDKPGGPDLDSPFPTE